MIQSKKNNLLILLPEEIEKVLIVNPQLLETLTKPMMQSLH